MLSNIDEDGGGDIQVASMEVKEGFDDKEAVNDSPTDSFYEEAPKFLKDFSKELYIQHEATLWENNPKYNRSIASGGLSRHHLEVELKTITPSYQRFKPPLKVLKLFL
ncbi:hypothetical protein ACFE04_003122 [Oxalis oulophora]